MIQIRENPNFPQWLQVVSFGRIVDEFQSRAEALHLAKKEAKVSKQKHIVFLGKAIDINE